MNPEHKLRRTLELSSNDKIYYALDEFQWAGISGSIRSKVREGIIFIVDQQMFNTSHSIMNSSIFNFLETER